MAEETTDQEATKEVEKTTPVAPRVYVLKSVVRGRTNRAARMVAPGRQPFVQRLAGGSIIIRRARPARITEAALKLHLEEIKKAVNAHQLVVTTAAGAMVDLDTFEVKPLAVLKKLPNPPLDSAKNDKNQNIGYDVPPTPEGTTMGAPTPELLQKSPLSEPDPEPAPEVTLGTIPSLLASEPAMEPALSDVPAEAAPEEDSEDASDEDSEEDSEEEETSDEPAAAMESAPGSSPSAPKASGKSKKNKKRKGGR